MDRYKYETSPEVKTAYQILDSKQGHDYVVAICQNANEAEKIVSALNEYEETETVDLDLLFNNGNEPKHKST